MDKLREYKDYNNYVEHQLEKTKNPKTMRAKRKIREKKIDKFRYTFNLCAAYDTDAKILCVGSRYGEEVESFNRNGFTDVTGIDLEKFPPYTIKMDMHNMDFEDNTFDIVYTNSLDHSHDIEKALREMIRVIKKDRSTLIIDLELGNKGSGYEVYLFKDVDEIKNLVDKINNNNGCQDMSIISNIMMGSRPIAYSIDHTKRVLLFNFYEE